MDFGLVLQTDPPAWSLVDRMRRAEQLGDGRDVLAAGRPDGDVVARAGPHVVPSRSIPQFRYASTERGNAGARAVVVDTSAAGVSRTTARCAVPGHRTTVEG